MILEINADCLWRWTELPVSKRRCWKPAFFHILSQQALTITHKNQWQMSQNAAKICSKVFVGLNEALKAILSDYDNSVVCSHCDAFVSWHCSFSHTESIWVMCNPPPPIMRVLYCYYRVPENYLVHNFSSFNRRTFISIDPAVNSALIITDVCHGSDCRSHDVWLILWNKSGQFLDEKPERKQLKVEGSKKKN